MGVVILSRNDVLWTCTLALFVIVLPRYTMLMQVCLVWYIHHVTLFMAEVHVQELRRTSRTILTAGITGRQVVNVRAESQRISICLHAYKKPVFNNNTHCWFGWSLVPLSISVSWELAE